MPLNLADADVFDSDVIRSLDNALSTEGGLLVLHGTLAPNASVSIGYQANHGGNSAAPGTFTLNGTTCSAS